MKITIEWALKGVPVAALPFVAGSEGEARRIIGRIVAAGNSVIVVRYEGLAVRDPSWGAFKQAFGA
jgi:hypothetical protein